MLFPYKYIPHKIEKFQKYLDFIFFEVWCKAKGKFNSSKLRGFPELKMIYEQLHFDETESGYFFNSHIERIYEDFLAISNKDRKFIKCWYRKNNQISALCDNKNIMPVGFKYIGKKHPSLGGHLKSFYSRLYRKDSPFVLAAFGNIKKIKAEHYNEFIKVNFDGHEGICPFCGLNSIKGNDHSTLEAYDHFLPQGNYPFNSVNFRNLAPMCHECNSSYKTINNPVINLDPLKKQAKRRKAFYPYSKKKWQIEIKLNLLNKDIKNLKKEEIEIVISSGQRIDHPKSWDEVFGITERYRAKLLGNHFGKKWFNDIKDGIHNARIKLNNPGLTKEQWIDYKLNECNEDLLADCNFLKKPFIEEMVIKNIV